MLILMPLVSLMCGALFSQGSPQPKFVWAFWIVFALSDVARIMGLVDLDRALMLVSFSLAAWMFWLRMEAQMGSGS